MLSQSEVDFINSNILKGIRPDLRLFNSKRDIKYKRLNNTHSDGCLEVILGYSHIRISLQFTKELEIISNYPLPPFPSLEGVGLNIHLEVYRDDGNIGDMFNNGLKYLFKEIEVPLISNNTVTSQVVNIILPESSTFAIFKNSEIIRDPSKVEEESCESLVTIFHNEKEVFGIKTCKSGKIVRPSEILKSIFN